MWLCTIFGVTFQQKNTRMDKSLLRREFEDILSPYPVSVRL
jgi:hypothetical protein